MVKQKLIFTSMIFSMGMSGLAFADDNPYSLFNSDTANSGSSQIQTAAPSTSSFVSSAPAQVQNSLAIKAPPVAATNSAPQIQYLQAANQVGKISAAPVSQAVSFAAPTVKSNGSGSAPQAQNAFTSLEEPTGETGTIPNYGDVLSQIQINTLNTANSTNAVIENIGATATSTANSETALTQLLQYWNTAPVYESKAVPTAFQAFLDANSYGSNALASLNTKYTANDAAAVKYLNNFVDLKADWPTIITTDPLPPLNESLPYTDILTGRVNQNGISEKYWTSAVNQTLFNLSINQDSMAALQKAVLVPFGGNPNWASQLQQATSPDLLRMIVMQQAVNNALTYQLLQRENDSALMQASELRMLSELNATMANVGQEQIRQQQRIVTAIEQSKAK